MDKEKKGKSKVDGNKGGKNDTFNLLISGGSLVVGTVGGVVLGRQSFKPVQTQEPTSEQVTTQKPVNTPTPVDTSHEPADTPMLANDKDEETSSESVDVETKDDITEDPLGKVETPENDTEPVDKVAKEIAGTSEIDNDDVVSPFMEIGAPTRMSDDNGNIINCFNVKFNDQNLKDYQFVLSDTDGDGTFETLLTSDGRPFSLTILNTDGGESSFEDILADAHIEYSDLEEMWHDDGSYLERNEIDDNSVNDLAMEDIIEGDEELDRQELIAMLNEVSNESEDLAIVVESEEESGFLYNDENLNETGDYDEFDA